MFTEFRQIAFDSLAGAGLIPVYQYLTDDLGTLPQAQIGRPTLTPSGDLPGAWQIELNVYVLGARTNAAGTQAQLDEFVWEAVQALENAKPGLGLVTATTVADVTPGVTPVAGQDYPSYIIRFVGTSQICR
jgi:hypothetical protein